MLIKNVIPKHLEATTAKLEEIGCDVEEFDDAIRVSASKRSGQNTRKDTAVPGLPDRYAAADRGYTGAGKRYEYCNREHF